MISAIAAIAAVFSAQTGNAATVEQKFTYAVGPNTTAFGAGQAEQLDVAMRISDPSLAGKEIVAIEAFVSSVEGISESSLWMSKKLTVTGGKNVPDIVSGEAAPEESNFLGVKAGRLYYRLEEPYLLTEEPVYCGFSFNIQRVTTQELRYPIQGTDNVNTNGFYLRGSNTLPQWSNMSSNLGGSAAIVVYLKHEVPDYSLDVVEALPVYLAEPSQFNGPIVVSNRGGNAVRAFDYSYMVDDALAIYSGTYNFDTPLQPDLSKNVEIQVPFEAIQGQGTHKVNFRITDLYPAPNQKVPNGSESPSVVLEVTNVPFVPKHRPLVEEYTGLWCGYCPMGYIAMEWLRKEYPYDHIPVCFHNDDAMEVTKSYPLVVSAFPMLSIDRKELINPYYGSSSDTHLGVEQDLLNARQVFAVADIKVDARIEGDVVKVNSTAKFVRDFDDSNYRIGYVLTCDGLTGVTWSQSNYLAGDARLYGTPLEEAARWGGKVFGLTFNSVVVDPDGMTGIRASLPKNIEAAKEYTHTFEYDIANNKLVQDRNNIVVVAFVMDAANNKIINAAKYSFSGDNEDAAVEIIEADGSVVSTVYYDLSGREVRNPSHGIFIKIDTLSDGSRITSKVVR